MYARKASSEDTKSFQVESTGKAFPNGTFLDLVQDPPTRQARLLVCTSSVRTVADHYEYDGAVYRPPYISSSLASAVPLPTRFEPFESTQILFASVFNAFAASGISEQSALAAAHFALPTWFPGALPAAPCLTITGPAVEADFYLRLLRTVIWRGLPLKSLHSNVSELVERLHPTLLVDARYLTKTGKRLLSASGGARSYMLRKNSAVNFAVAKAIYLGEQRDPDFPIDFAMHVHLAPAHGTPCMVDDSACAQMFDRFQPQLLEYRLRHRAAVLASTFDLPQMPAEARVIARTLGACIVDAPEIQAGIQPLLQSRESQISEARLVDPTCVVIEVLLAKCHASSLENLRLKEVTEAAQLVLKSRGEVAELEPRAVGAILDDLDLPRKRESRGYRIKLTAAARRQIHLLARDHDVESMRKRPEPCDLCIEFFGVTGAAEKSVG